MIDAERFKTKTPVVTPDTKDEADRNLNTELNERVKETGRTEEVVLAGGPQTIRIPLPVGRDRILVELDVSPTFVPAVEATGLKPGAVAAPFQVVNSSSRASVW